MLAGAYGGNPAFQPSPTTWGQGGGFLGSFVPAASPSPSLTGGSISGSHTSTAAETVFTFVTYTFPRPAQPIMLTITSSAGAGLVRVVLDNQRNLDIPTAINTVVPQPLSAILSAYVNALSVGFECIAGVATISATVTYN